MPDASCWKQYAYNSKAVLVKIQINLGREYFKVKTAQYN
jgi:hypothetical protein